MVGGTGSVWNMKSLPNSGGSATVAQTSGFQSCRYCYILVHVDMYPSIFEHRTKYRLFG